MDEYKQRLSPVRYEFINMSSPPVHIMPIDDETFTPFTVNPGEEESLRFSAIQGDIIDFAYSPASQVRADSDFLVDAVVFTD